MSKSILRLTLIPALLLGACSTPEKPEPDRVTTAKGRVYNPQSGRYEWETPGHSPVSPGASETSRAPYR